VRLALDNFRCPLAICVFCALLATLLPSAGCGPRPDATALVGSQRASQETQRKSREQEAFERTFERWKALMKQLRDVDIEYRTAHPSRREPIEERYDEIVKQAERLERELTDAAVLAFVDDPSSNQGLAQFLLGVLSMEMVAERYEDALRLAQLLIDNEIKIPQLYNLAGVAAYNSNLFELSRKHLRRAHELNALDESGRKCAAALAYSTEAWAEEQKLREAETAARNLPRVVLHTNKGEIEIELFEDQAPNTVANFISLVEDDFYNGLTFHRVKEGFMAQAGCPKGDGTGGPGYTIRCEAYEDNARKHFRGSVAMANRGPHTGGSQFYINFVPTPNLDGRHTVFGRVVRGLDVLAKLQRREPRDPVEVAINPHANIVIPRADRIARARVIRKRDHEYSPVVKPEPEVRPQRDDPSRMAMPGIP
jgi:cyclophilin family peptidyl-prolyl cis-trans isomerase